MRSSANTENTPLLKGEERHPQEVFLSLFGNDIERLKKFNQRILSVRQKYKKTQTKKKNMKCCHRTTCLCACIGAIGGGSATSFYYLAKFIRKADSQVRHEQKEIMKHYSQQLRNTTYFKQSLEGHNETCQDIIPAKLKRGHGYTSDHCFLNVVTNPNDFYLNCTAPNYPSPCLVPFNGSVQDLEFCHRNYIDLDSYDHMRISCGSDNLDSAIVGTGVAGGIGSITSLILLVLFILSACTYSISSFEGKLSDHLLDSEEEKELNELTKKYPSLPKAAETTILELSNALAKLQEELIKEEERKSKLVQLLLGCDKEKSPESHLPELNINGGDFPLDVFKEILFFGGIINKPVQETNQKPEDNLGNANFNV